jgi:hypothetical protein
MLSYGFLAHFPPVQGLQSKELFVRKIVPRQGLHCDDSVPGAGWFFIAFLHQLPASNQIWGLSLKVAILIIFMGKKTNDKRIMNHTIQSKQGIQLFWFVKRWDS